jgi:RNA polymerase sigma-70 factor (ECF subfamily)
VNDHDDELLSKARGFDREAITTIYDTYHQPLYRYVYRQVGSVEVARDLTAEVFQRFLQALKNGNGPNQQLKAWLYRVAHNLVVDYFRRRQHRDDLPLDEYRLYSDSDPVHTAEEHIDSECVMAALNRLTPEQRQVISLKFFAGMSNQEAAEVMAKPVGAVKALQHRAIAALQIWLVPVEEGVL